MASEQPDSRAATHRNFYLEPCDQLPADGNCPICLESYEGAEGAQRPQKLLPCKHIFHLGCVSGWLTKGHVTCPYCRCVLHYTEIRASTEQMENGPTPDTTGLQAITHAQGTRSASTETETTLNVPINTGPSLDSTQAQRERFALGLALLARSYLELERRAGAGTTINTDGWLELASRLDQIPHTLENFVGLDRIDPLNIVSAQGQGHVYTASHSVVLGRDSRIEGIASVIHAHRCNIIGYGLVVVGTQNFILGGNNIVEGAGNTVVGEDNVQM